MKPKIKKRFDVSPTPEQLADRGRIDRIPAITPAEWKQREAKYIQALQRADARYRNRARGGKATRPVERLNPRTGKWTRYPSILAASIATGFSYATIAELVSTWTRPGKPRQLKEKGLWRRADRREEQAA